MITAMAFFLFATLTNFGLFTFLGWMAVVAEFGYIMVKTW
jgi:hypothetical protein